MEPIHQSEAKRYNRLIAKIDEVYHEIAVRQGYSNSAMSILYALSDNGGQCRLPELIQASGVQKQTVNSALRKLEKEGIVYLEPAGGRSKRVCLTEKGAAVAHETVDRVMELEERIYASWTKEEWETYIRLTQRYLSQLQEAVKEIL